jgi:calcium channel MID1
MVLLSPWLGAMATYKRRRRRDCSLCMLLGITLVTGVLSQSSTSIKPSSSTSTTLPAATLKPVNLVESVPVHVTLDVNSSVPAQFFLAAPFKNTTSSLFVSASLCSGPSIPPYNISDPDVLSDLQLSYYQASLATLVRMYVSTDPSNTIPGANDLLGKPDDQYLLGGFAQDENTVKDPPGAWITIWPPADTRNVTGTWNFTLTASTEGSPMSLQNQAGISFADSDAQNALLTSFGYPTSNQPNLTLYVLPTPQDPGSLSTSEYFNSSVCAIASAFNTFNTIQDSPSINSSETQRGLTKFDPNQQRLQFQVSDLQPGTNYTAWLVEYGQFGSPAQQSAKIWPAVKFITKTQRNCRLVYDVDFCPQVAYSIPISPSVTTEQALSIINNTVSPNFNNFSATIDTFPCNSTQFGEYSPVQKCSDCKRQYQDWLCAVTMPRCVDRLPSSDDMNQTAAVSDPTTMNGIGMEINPQLLPYIMNRDNNSRQGYIDSEDGLDAGTYGELLPCIYTCYFVSRSCPMPLIQWACPVWDISAQSSYGTFADVGMNAGAGTDGQKWGGPAQYIAQDAFGNLFCNSMGTTELLTQIGAASAIRPGLKLLLLSVTTASVLLWTAALL